MMHNFRPKKIFQPKRARVKVIEETVGLSKETARA
jgi:hypothetical protein